MADKTGLQFTVKAGMLPENTFAVTDFILHEALNAPFILTLNLASVRADIEFAKVLDNSCELKIWYSGELQRQVYGIVSEFSQGDTGFHRTRYHMQIRPLLWRAGLRRNSRIFQDKQPQEIIETLLRENGVVFFRFYQDKPALKREYCVQYRESDLDFITRLAAEEGMCFYHDFTDGNHCLIFTDYPQAMHSVPGLFYNPSAQGMNQGAYIRRFSYREAVRTGEVELRDHTFKNPASSLQHKHHAGQALAHQNDSYQYYDSPGRYKQDESGEKFARFHLDALRADAVMAQGEGICPALRPGILFVLKEHPNPAVNIRWQVVSVSHEGRQPQALEEEGGDEGTFLNSHFQLIPGDIPWRSLAKKPLVDGPQLARVTGPQNEEIYCDGYGRVRVRFPWDRDDGDDDSSSCWIQVSQGWAGPGYGMQAIPRVGHEVLVSFLEGDPDQPFITGRAHHAVNRPPDLLPHNKTRTIIRSRTAGGSGFNELRFEDLPGREQIYQHAEKDMDVVINQHHRRSVGKDQHLTVEQDKFEQVKRHSHHITGQDYFGRTGGDFHQFTGNDLIQKIVQSVKRWIGGGEITHIEGSRQVRLNGSDELIIGAHQRTVVNSDHYLQAAEIVLEAGQSLTIKAGGGFIKIDSDGITLSGDKISMNEDGLPDSGIAPVAMTPEAPAEPGEPELPDRR